VNTASTITVASSYWSFFTNPFAADCGVITISSLWTVGAVNPYTGGNLIIDPSTGEIKAKQNVDASFTETVCVKGENAAGSVVYFDNWSVT